MTDYPKLLSSFQLWLGQQGQYTPRSQQNYGAIIEAFLKVLANRDIPRLNDMDMALLDTFLHRKADHQPYAPGTVLVRRAALTAFFTWAYSQNLCREHFMLRYRKDHLQLKQSRPSGASLTSPSLLWTSEEQQAWAMQLASAVLPESHLSTAALLALILATGLYAQEACTLMYDTLHLEAKTLFVTQGIRARKVHIDNQFCETLLHRWLEIRAQLTPVLPVPYLFYTAQFVPLKIQSLHTRCEGLFKQLPTLTFPSAAQLRQLAILRWVQAGKSYEDIQTQFGFIQMGSLKRYLKNLEVKDAPPIGEGK